MDSTRPLEKPYTVINEECKYRKDKPIDHGYILLRVIRSEIEIYQTMNSQQILNAHEKDCLRAAQEYRSLLKQMDYSKNEEEDQEKEEESKKVKENNIIMQTMREDCLKGYEELIEILENESTKETGGMIKKYRVGDKLVESIVTIVAVLQYYIKACLRLGDLTKAEKGYEKITNEYAVTSPAIRFLVLIQ